jgi:hypothetical protein
MPATQKELPDGNVDVAVVNSLDVQSVFGIRNGARSPQVTLAFRSFAGYRRAFAEYRMTLKVPFGSMAPVDQPREQRRWNLK